MAFHSGIHLYQNDLYFHLPFSPLLYLLALFLPQLLFLLLLLLIFLLHLILLEHQELVWPKEKSKQNINLSEIKKIKKYFISRDAYLIKDLKMVRWQIYRQEKIFYKCLRDRRAAVRTENIKCRNWVICKIHLKGWSVRITPVMSDQSPWFKNLNPTLRPNLRPNSDDSLCNVMDSCKIFGST